MEEIVYNSLSNYFSALSKVGYIPYNNVLRLLVLVFYKHFIFEDYRGYVKETDYRLIERALNCLFGSSCLIPYPDYLKMGKLKLGDTTEIIQRVKSNEEYAQDIDNRLKLNDAVTADNTRRIVEAEVRLDDHDQHLSILDGRATSLEDRTTNLESRANNAEARLTEIESTRVVKNKQNISEVPDIILD